MYLLVYSYDLFLKSGSSNTIWGLRTPEQIELSTEQFVSHTGCANDDTLLQCLQEVPAEDLAITDGITVIVGPVVDGTTLLDDPLTLIASYFTKCMRQSFIKIVDAFSKQEKKECKAITFNCISGIREIF